ncbi:MAG TPA: pitrilysin family protein [Stellaceae bacterium]|nr:pitrilysin family protein [Stellaceae bacterium]
MRCPTLRGALALLFAVVLSVGAARASGIAEVKSPGGITAWLIEDHTLPLIAVEFSFDGGTALDPSGEEGRANLAMDLLDEGAGELDSQAFKSRVEDLSVRLDFDASYDAVGGTMRTLSANADAAFDLLRLSLTSPRFDPAAIERVKSQVSFELREGAEAPRVIADRIWWRTAFPDHPYGRRSAGSLASIATLEADDLRRFVAERFGRDKLTVGVVGDITPERLQALLDRTFGALPAHAAAAAVADTAAFDEGALLVVNMPIPQSVVTFGERGIKRNDPDWYVALVMNEILAGNGVTSRLTAEIREKRGLAYGVGAGLSPLRHAGILYGRVATRNDRVGDVLGILRSEWRRFRDDGPTPAELAAAKTYLIGSFPLSLDTTSRLAGLLVSLQVEKLGMDYIEQRAKALAAVTVDDVRRVAKRLLDPDRLRIVIVGAPKGLVGATEIAADGG